MAAVSPAYKSEDPDFGALLADPDLTMFELDRIDAERSLAEFVKQSWSTIETVRYMPNWHIDCICEHLEAVARGELRGILLINVPFRTAKSRLVSVFFPAWVWAQDPDPERKKHGYPVKPDTWLGPGTKILSVSHRVGVSIRDADFSRRIIGSDWYQERWGDRVQVRSTHDRGGDFANTAGGIRLASAKGSVLGQGGDIIIADDLINREDAHSAPVRDKANEYWGQTLRTRMNDPQRSVFVVIMQRLHEMDPAGLILATEKDVTHVNLPMEYEPERRCYTPLRTSISQEAIEAKYLRSKQMWIAEGDPVPDGSEEELEKRPIERVYANDPRMRNGELMWPERFDRASIDSFKNSLGSYGAAGQLQQRPAPRGGGMFQRAWFEVVDAAPVAPDGIVRRWDFSCISEAHISMSADWTVGVRMSKSRDGYFFIEHIDRFRGSNLDIEKRVKFCASQDAARDRRCVQLIVQDPGAAGKFVAQHLVRQISGFLARTVSESGAKDARAEPLAAQCEAGNVKLVKGMWNEPFLDEICTFPSGEHDDQVDATSGAFKELVQRGQASTGFIKGLY